MKRLIRWLADISGVTRDIQEESAITIGHRMQQYAYWFNGGLMHNFKPLKPVANILYKYPKMCLLNGQPSLYASQFENLRSELYKMAEEDKWVFTENKKDR